MEAWVVLCTCAPVIWGKGVVEINLCWENEPWVKIWVSQNLARGQYPSLLWVSASSSVQIFEFHDPVKFLTNPKEISIYIFCQVRKAKFRILPSLQKKRQSFKLSKFNLMKNSLHCSYYVMIYSWTGDILSWVGPSPCLGLEYVISRIPSNWNEA